MGSLPRKRIRKPANDSEVFSTPVAENSSGTQVFNSLQIDINVETTGSEEASLSTVISRQGQSVFLRIGSADPGRGIDHDMSCDRTLGYAHLE